MLGVSGLRGIVGESLTPEVAIRYAAAFGAWLQSRDTGESAVVARDGRAGGSEVMKWTIEGLKKSGVRIVDAGVCMTPTVGVLVDEIGAGGAIIITASHNPQEWNGLKLLLNGEKYPPTRIPEETVAETAAPTAAQADKIIALFHNGESWNPIGPLSKLLPSSTISDAAARHVAITMSYVKKLGKIGTKFRVVVDSVNSSGIDASKMLLSELGAELARHLGSDSSGIFPHTPEPTAENLSGEGGLCDAVPGLKADVGFAQDPDGDRLAIVDEKGTYIGEEYTLVLAAMSLLEAERSRGHEHADPDEKTLHPGPLPEGEREGDAVICVNLSTSRMIDDIAARYGVRVVRTAVGEANVVEAMKRLKRKGHEVILGGEGNGGVIWPKVTYVRDSLSAMALTLSLMARTGKTVSQLVDDIPRYTILKRKQPLARKELAVPTVARLAAHYRAAGPGVRVDTQDGVRIDFDATRAWVHVRASNTEPILRLIAEAPTQGLAEAVLDEVQRLVDGV